MSASQHDPSESNPDQTVDELRAEMGGRWLVRSRGSSHIWDLDQGTYERRPGAASLSGAFDYDGVPHSITRVEQWPKVGSKSLVWFDDPRRPLDVEQFRRSSTIVRIERYPTDPDTPMTVDG
ncbi:MAG TPA: hypothetical protein VEF72_31185 [Mycobacterium sp.]|nr:hypothetical protein [Mycobacterium sp.]